ncbi:hypothetical protein [Streptomyces cremeus]|uniref:Uncharacterized protein n=1 Tax=Streptomyces cremeus TaxID=66881 RepID=A0ABV5PFG4_STRCM
MTFEALALNHSVDGPRLTVTGAKPGEMTITTHRGPAVVPAWLFSLAGYASPLKHAAVTPSEPPRSPLAPAENVPGNSLQHVVRIAANGRSVSVMAIRGQCDNVPAVKALETRGSVVLTSYASREAAGKLCTKQGKEEHVTVRMKRTLGDRVLLDALSGRPLTHRPETGLSVSRGGPPLQE